MDENGKFDMHCVVELMGHQQVAGRVTEQVIAGATLLRVDVPKTSKRDGFTKFYGASAIYAITPVEEKVAAAMAEAFAVEPVSEWRLRGVLDKPALPEKIDRWEEHWASDNGFEVEKSGEDDDSLAVVITTGTPLKPGEVPLITFSTGEAPVPKENLS